jgi:hypothetical protein
VSHPVVQPDTTTAKKLALLLRIQEDLGSVSYGCLSKLIKLGGIYYLSLSTRIMIIVDNELKILK